MAKLTDNSFTRAPIGNDGLLRFIDEMNEIRARSGQRHRYRPMDRGDGVLAMEEHFAVPPPVKATSPSPRFSNLRLVHG
jgi:hypothetical protein